MNKTMKLLLALLALGAVTVHAADAASAGGGASTEPTKQKPFTGPYWEQEAAQKSRAKDEDAEIFMKAFKAGQRLRGVHRPDSYKGGEGLGLLARRFRASKASDFSDEGRKGKELAQARSQHAVKFGRYATSSDFPFSLDANFKDEDSKDSKFNKKVDALLAGIPEVKEDAFTGDTASDLLEEARKNRIRRARQMARAEEEGMTENWSDWAYYKPGQATGAGLATLVAALLAADQAYARSKEQDSLLNTYVLKKLAQLMSSESEEAK